MLAILLVLRHKHLTVPLLCELEVKLIVTLKVFVCVCRLSVNSKTKHTSRKWSRNSIHNSADKN